MKEMIRQIAKCYVSNRIKLYPYSDALFYISSQKYRDLKKKIRDLEGIDSICCIDEFADAIKPYIDSTEFLRLPGYYYGSYLYGYYEEILNYSNVGDWRIPFLGYMEHGVDFCGTPIKYDDKRISYCGQGKMMADMIHDANKYALGFAIGPYIQYSREYYTEESISNLKKEWGKTLLVFPGHSCENEDFRCKESNFFKWIDEYAKGRYDTVVVCAYWNDIFSKDIQEFKNNGYRIVSAGFRGDKNFVRRLKTIIGLSDCVVGNDIGTNIGFALALGKEYVLYPNDLRKLVHDSELGVRDYPLSCELVESFIDAFSVSEKRFNQVQKEKQRELYTEWWGGGIKYSPEQMNRLFLWIKRMIINSGYNVKRFNQLIKDCYNGIDIDGVEILDEFDTFGKKRR